jgi:hypothetical protein
MATHSKRSLRAEQFPGAVNHDGNPLDMSTVFRSRELRFDAYVVRMATMTLTVAPPAAGSQSTGH